MVPGCEYPGGVKHFLVYTGLRIGLFLVCWAVLVGIGSLAFGGSTKVGIWALVLAAVLSSLLSLRYLAGPRERFAQSVQARAERATAAFEDMKTREDAD
ncbi:DUF4229 domain-containing protein [Nocardioides marmorisolisilvae]|uniref:DUF4229 domain-containing protein n=1 Tax=Nocardioides marmorisolisilvae TaxID=1542737 RepID=A0A3N0DZY3_9ACTN|nr:DUF4229 domain-containing protein [Nocardioides marmorisolisilvae]